jgi:hypothetical protein
MTDTRHEIESRLTGLRRDRGAATLAGKKFDPSVIASVEAELAALDDAEGERARRDRETAAQEQRERLSDLRKQFAKLDEDRLTAWSDAEVAARTLVTALARILETSEAMSAIAGELAPRQTPLALHRPEIITRIAHRLSAVMSTLAGHRHRLGCLSWHAGPYRSEQNWRASEAALLGKDA